MNIETVRAFFGWCTVINGTLLIGSSLVVMVCGGWVYRLQSRWFPMTREAFTLTIYGFLGAMKLLVLVFNVTPYLALVLVT